MAVASAPMPFTREPRRWLGTASLCLALAPVAVAPLLMGAVHAPVMAALALVEALALAAHLLDRRLRRAPLTTSWLGLPILLGLVGSIASLVPLPGFLLRVIAPDAHERASLTGALLLEQRVASVWSLDPPETALAVLRLFAALCCFIVVADRCRKREARSLAFRVLLATGLVIFTVAAGHRLADATAVWGRFGVPSSPFFAPLVNPNHLARFFGALSLACLGRALVLRSRTEALWFAGGAVACGAGVFLTLSRGGMLAFVAGGIVLVALFVRAARDQGGSGRFGAAVGAPLLALAALAGGLFVAREAIVKEMSTLDQRVLETSKVGLYLPALRVALAHPLTGIGNDAFGVAVPAFIEGELPPNYTFTHVENGVLEVLVAHGAVLGSAMLLAVLCASAVTLARLRTRSEVVGVAALAFLLLGELFDFVLQIGGGALLGATLAGLLAARLMEQGATVVRAPMRGALMASAILVVVVLALTPAALMESRRGLDPAIAEAAPAARRALLEHALARHPSDAHYAYELAVEARRATDARLALRYANRAMLLWPTLSGAHLEAARALFAMGRREQGFTEYRLAFVASFERDRIVREVAKRTDDVEERRRAIPAEDAVALAMVCAELGLERRLQDKQACDDDAAGMAGATPGMQRAAVETALARADGAGARVRLASLTRDGVDAALAARAAALIAGAGPAFEESTTWLPGLRQPRPLLEWRLQTAVALRRFDDAERTLGRLRGLGGDHASMDRLDRAEAELAAVSGDLAKALRAWTRIAARMPKDVGPLLQRGRLELLLGMIDEATSTAARAKAIAPADGGVVQFAAAVDDARRRELEGRMRQQLHDVRP